MGDDYDEAQAAWDSAGRPDFDEDAGPEDWRATDPANGFLEKLWLDMGRKPLLDLPYGQQELNYIRANLPPGNYSAYRVSAKDLRQKGMHALAYRKACPKCGALPGFKCTYTRDNQIHNGPHGEIVWNEIGHPMLITHVERRQAGIPILGPKEENMSMSKQQAEALAAAAGEALAKYAKLVEKYGEEPEPGSVIKFARTWSSDPMGRTFEYAAVRTRDAGQLWYTTGPKSPKAYTWEDLMHWLDSDQGIDYLQIVKAGGWTNYPRKK